MGRRRATRKGTSVVSVDDPIGIEHGDDSKQEATAQGDSHRVVTGKKIDDAVHHP